MPISRIPRDKSYPVVLFMHGCWGSDTKEHFDWASLLTAQGYLVVMPNSFARPKHKRTCAFINRHGGARPAVHDMRLAEIEYAKKQIEQQPWFDGRNLFLMGYSEGAIAAVRTPLEGFRGVIAIAWTCTHRSYPPLHGIFLPKSTSLLTLSYEQDSWFPLTEVQGNCGQHMRGRRYAKHVVLPNQGRIHHILHKVDKRIFNIFDTHGHNHGGFNNENARQEVMQFIAQNLRR